MAGDQLVVPRGVTPISCHYKNTIEGTGENRTNDQTRTGVNSRAEGELCNTLHSCSIYGLTLAWVTSENSTKQLECRLILTRCSFTGPYLLCYCVRSRLTLSMVPRQLSQLLSPTNSLLASRNLSRPRRDFKSKNPLSGFAPKQTKESSAWRATYIVLHVDFALPVDHRVKLKESDKRNKVPRPC